MSTGSGMFSGAASGAMAGSSLGPWGAVGGAVIGGISGLLGSRSAKRAAQRAAEEDNQRRAAQAWGADQYNQLGNRYGEAAKFVPTGVRTAYGTGQMGPDGMMTGELDPRYTGYRDNWDQLFQGELGRMMNFDPEALAADRYKKMQSLVLPGREEQLDTTQGMMLRRGMIGSAATGADGRSTNPMYNSLARAWGDEDTKMGLESINFADARRAQGYNMLGGMMGQIQGIDALSEKPLQNAYQWSGMMNSHNLAALAPQYEMYGQGVGTQMKSMMPASFVREAQDNRTATNTAGATSFLNQLPGLFSMFRGQTPPPQYGASMMGNDPYAIGSWNTN